LAANSNEQEIAEYKITATDDSASLTEVGLYNYAGGAKTAAADSRISLIKLYDDQGNLIQSFTPVNGGGKFIINNDAFKVAANTSRTLVVKAVLNTISNDASATNKALAYAITYVKSKSSNGTVSTYGDISNATAMAGATANGFIVRKTVPTVAFLALPDTTLNAGTKDIAKFSVSADAAGDVTLNSVALDVATTTDATLATTTNPLKVNGSNKNATAVLAGTKYIVTFANPEVISAGTSKTFEIQANTSVSGNNSDSITAKISEDATFQTDTTAVNNGNFVWSDGASVTAYTWANGYEVSGLTTNTWVMSK